MGILAGLKQGHVPIVDAIVDGFACLAPFTDSGQSNGRNVRLKESTDSKDSKT